MIEMELGGLGFDPRNMSPIVLLRDKEERNFLPIWIGMFEAAAIAMELQEFKPPRPMTHDLITAIIDEFGAKVDRVIINEIKDDTFYAVVKLTFDIEAGEEILEDDLIEIDARPSDAIAIAVRTDAPIFVAESVMLKAKMVNSEKDEEETKKFKRFVENVNPEDFIKYQNRE
jgi:bifunctional DNase/RNase